MFAVPSYVGPLTMPNYEALAAHGIYPLANGGKVFAGQRDESFYIDFGAAFDTLNLSRTPPVLTPAEGANVPVLADTARRPQPPAHRLRRAAGEPLQLMH